MRRTAGAAAMSRLLATTALRHLLLGLRVCLLLLGAFSLFVSH